MVLQLLSARKPNKKIKVRKKPDAKFEYLDIRPAITVDVGDPKSSGNHSILRLFSGKIACVRNDF